MLELVINGRRTMAQKGASILETCLAEGLEIPTLCYHRSLSPHGSCRLCMVEVGRNGKLRLEAACMEPVEEGLQVRTTTRRVRGHVRRMIQFLLAENPKLPRIRQLADRFGVPDPGNRVRGHDCLYCALCVRVCREIVGRAAVNFEDRALSHGKGGMPFRVNPAACIDCGACSFLCPTGAIQREIDMLRMANVLRIDEPGLTGSIRAKLEEKIFNDHPSL